MTENKSSALSARELEWAVNPEELIEEHKKVNGPIVRTRFPPEPNGYLHIGHAKSMYMNFILAFEKLEVPEQNRRTVFRYDDTNPDAESTEYIDSLRRDLEWMGYRPEITTYSSDNFDKLYQLAIQLIDEGLAYVCDMSKAEMEVQRELAMKRANARSKGLDVDKEVPIPSPDVLPGRNRNTSVERNRALFEKMRAGCFKEGQYTLRLKMDFESPNPNMYDLVAYRIKYTPHPHAGSGWCIYPSYDYTHGTCDSIEHIDYSICTLEFETRREPYYWILQACRLYRPKVYEMSRLNLQYTVLSKRRLLKLVNSNFVRGWDDCRMPTISGIRRKGYTPEIVRTFCADLGATRAANVVEWAKLEQSARTVLARTCSRAMVCLDPITIKVTNWEEAVKEKGSMTFEVQNHATDESMGSHSIALTETFYLDSSDFRMEDSKQYYGLAPNKAVGLKYYGGNLVCDKVVEEGGKVKLLECHLDHSEGRPKPKTYLSWVPSTGVPAEIRVYEPLFTVAEPSDLWEDELNQKSEKVYTSAIVDPSFVVDRSKIDPWISNASIQFERFGYFVLDKDTPSDPCKPMVLNRTVSLKEETGKKSAEEQAAAAKRREQVHAEQAKKAERMLITAENFFKEAEEHVGKFSKYDETGLPTHEADGTELTKSALKRLEKTRQKHLKQVMNWQKNQNK